MIEIKKIKREQSLVKHHYQVKILFYLSTDDTFEADYKKTC